MSGSLENEVIISAITNLQGQIERVGNRVDQVIDGIGEVKVEVAAQARVLENVHIEVRRTNGRVTDLEMHRQNRELQEAAMKAFRDGEAAVRLRWVSTGKRWIVAGRWLWAVGLALLGTAIGYFGSQP